MLCNYFGKCGGCSLDGSSYSHELERKKDGFISLMSSAGIKPLHAEIKQFYAGNSSYRNRMDFIFHNGSLGLRRKGKWHKIVNIENCAIANNRIREIASIINCSKELKGIECFDVRKHKGILRYAVIRATSLVSSVSFVLNSASSRISDASEKIREFAESEAAKRLIDNVIITYVRPNTDISVSEDYYVVRGTDRLRENILGCSFSFNVQGFFQNNIEVTEMLHSYCNSLLSGIERPENSILLDLYSGAGCFGIINSPLFSKGFMLESYEKGTDDALANISENNVGNLRAITKDAKQLKAFLLSEGLFGYGKAMVVIADPPRAGMHAKTIQALNELSAKALVYVSCNPKQLVKDILKLKSYKLVSCALFDMFPRTWHYEAVAFLASKQPSL